MPTCELRPVRSRATADALARLRTFVSPFTGVVRGVAEALAAPDEHRLVSFGCEVADGLPTVAAQLDDFTGSEHWLRDAAEAAAISEALERYSAAYVPSERLVRSSGAALQGAVAPGRFALFHESQLAADAFPYRPLLSDTVVSWVDGFALPGGTSAYLPAQLVFMHERVGPPDDARIGHTTSSGLACAETVEEAALTGLLELIERDAVMIAWYDRLSLPLLDWGGDPDLVRIDERYFAPTGLRYSAVDLSVFFAVPTVLGVVHGTPGTLGALGVGAACAPRIEVAWRKALAEAFAVQRWVRDRALEHPEDLGQPADEIRTFGGHTMFYAHPERASRAAFLDGSGDRRDTRDVAPLPGATVAEQVEAVCERLTRHGASAYAIDVTCPDVRAMGFRVVRVLAPELCQLDVVERARFLGARRLYDAAHAAGLVPSPLMVADLNPDPHPFP